MWWETTSEKCWRWDFFLCVSGIPARGEEGERRCSWYSSRAGTRANQPGVRLWNLIQLCLWVSRYRQILNICIIYSSKTNWVLKLHSNISSFSYYFLVFPSYPIIFYSSVSRLAGMDQAIHKLNVGHYTLDVKVSQLMDRLSRMDGRTSTSFFFTNHHPITSIFFFIHRHSYTLYWL